MDIEKKKKTFPCHCGENFSRKKDLKCHYKACPIYLKYLDDFGCAKSKKDTPCKSKKAKSHQPSSICGN